MWESLWILRSVESKLFPYIYDMWVASKHWSVPSARNAPSALTPSAPWGRQPYEGVTLKVPCEVFRHFLFSDEYYGNRRIRKTPSTHVAVVNPCRCSKPSACSWLQHLLFFFHISCPLLHNLVDFKTDGFVESCQINFLGLEKREDRLVNSLIRDAFNAQNTCQSSVGLVSNEGVTSSSARFCFLYI